MVSVLNDGEIALRLFGELSTSPTGDSNSIRMSPDVYEVDIWLGLRMGDGGVKQDSARSTDEELGKGRGVVGFALVSISAICSRYAEKCIERYVRRGRQDNSIL